MLSSVPTTAPPAALLPAGHKWWRRLARSLPAALDDRIAAGVAAPTGSGASGVSSGGAGSGGKKSGGAGSGGSVWGQWRSAAITFAGVAESDASGEATETARREPLSYADCAAIFRACEVEHPGTRLVELPLPHPGRRACVVYIPGYFNAGGLSQERLVEEMQRVQPAFIDRHMQNRGPTKTMHKNLRWNTNITDNLYARNADGVYAACQRATKEAKKKFALTGDRHDLRIAKLTSSEVPFSQLPEFSKARAKISALGEAVLPMPALSSSSSSSTSVVPAIPAMPAMSVSSGDDKNSNLTDLCCELNFYFSQPCQPGGIGFHGDAERNLVFGGSIGSENRMIEWCRFEKDKPYIDPVTGKQEIYRLTLRPGDAYVMSEWAAGITWRKEAKSHVTIRHRAGTQAFLLGSAGKIKLPKGAVHAQHPVTLEDQHNFRTTDYSGCAPLNMAWVSAKKKNKNKKKKTSGAGKKRRRREFEFDGRGGGGGGEAAAATVARHNRRKSSRAREAVKYVFSSEDEE